MLHPHAALIDALGGSAALSARFGLQPNVTGNWRTRGIAWPWRPEVAKLARRKRIPLPGDFLTPGRSVATDAAD